MESQHLDYRCKNCHKLLFRGVLVEADVEIMCKGCHALNTFAKSEAPELLCMVKNCPHRVFCPTAQKDQK